MLKHQFLDFELFHLKDSEIVIYDKNIRFNKQKPIIAIFGSSSEFQEKRGIPPISDLKKLCISLGKELGENKWNILTSGCTGVPYWIAKEAKRYGSFVISFSPFKSEKEHKKDKKIIPSFPIDQNSAAIYTNLGFQFCDILASYLCDSALIIGGGLGSLRESASLVEYGKPLICFNETGGVSASIPQLFKENFVLKLSLLTCKNLTQFKEIINQVSFEINGPNKQIVKLLRQIYLKI